MRKWGWVNLVEMPDGVHLTYFDKSTDVIGGTIEDAIIWFLNGRESLRVPEEERDGDKVKIVQSDDFVVTLYFPI